MKKSEFTIVFKYVDSNGKSHIATGTYSNITKLVKTPVYCK